MQLLHQPGNCLAPEEGTVCTIGAYDGVHLGHRALIARVKAAAADLHCASAVVTFDRHPATVVRPESAPKLLTDLDQKLELLAATGLDYALVVRFDLERSTETAEEFVRDVLVGCLRARAVVVGYDFHFGYKRQGDVALLAAMGAELGFDVTGVRLTAAPRLPAGACAGPGAVVGGRAGDGAGGRAGDGSGGRAGDGAGSRSADGGSEEPVSSTRVRRLLASGDVEDAARLLGRPHQVRGVVEHGDGRGRELGFPTANVAVASVSALPADGVYAGWYVGADQVRRRAALSLGRRPTFYEDAGLSLLEAHLVDFAGDLYDQAARVEFVRRLRGQQRFDSAGELSRQIAEDVRFVRALLED